MTMIRSNLLVLGVFALVALVQSKVERNSPHGHAGLIKKYQPGPFDLSLKASDEKELESGKAVMKQVMPKKGETGGGGAICVQDIEAPKEAVWNQILRLDDYKGKVPKVLECKNYDVQKGGNGVMTMKTKQRLGILPGYSYENYYEHTYEPKKESLVWTLDYNKKSDFEDVAGHWHLEEHPSKPDCTRVFYACDIKLAGAVPGPVLKIISQSALRQATAWVKKESEKAPTLTYPKMFARRGEGSKSPGEKKPVAIGGFSFRRGR